MDNKILLTTGVLGGMGPQATVDFMSKVIQQTPALLDQDHLPLIIDHNTLVPNRHKSLNGTGIDAKEPLKRMAIKLETAGADFLVMVCNTAHAYQEDIRAATTIPFISIVDEVTSYIQTHYPDVKKVGIMAAEGCLEANIYQSALSNNRYVPIQWDKVQSQQFMKLLFEIKTGNFDDDSTKAMTILANDLKAKGAEVIIAGCTEIPLVMTAQNIDIPLIESTDILVKQTIAYATQQLTLPTNQI
jgi:aspartate racemase